MRYDFASDTVCGLAPEAVEGLLLANKGLQWSYGADIHSARTADLIRERLDCDAEVRFLPSGTAANAIGLSILASPQEAVLAHEMSHICRDEAGAPGFIGHGMGIVTCEGASAKLSLGAVDHLLSVSRSAHRQSLAALSITNATELGAVYSNEEVRVLVARAKSHGLRAHLDGARLTNAVANGFDLKRLAGAGLDIVVFGGGKAGAGNVEALVVLDKSLTRNLDQRLKQAGHLPAQTRLLAAPLMGLLETGAWERGGRHANQMAQALAAALTAKTPYRIRHPVEANMVFVDMPPEHHARLAEQGWCVFPGPDGATRFVCSWASKLEAIEEVVETVAACADEFYSRV